MASDSILGKLLIKGNITIKTPLIIGSKGKTNDVDIVVVKDEKGNPYIPATSMAGVLRHYFYQNADVEEVDKTHLRYFWGADYFQNDDNICQSALYISDLTLVNDAQIKVRDGVAINNELGIAQEKNKFDYEIVEPGAKFNLKMEITFRDEHQKDTFVKILAFLVQALKNSKIFIGAMTTKGFGRCILTNEQYYELDFCNKQDVIAWLSRNIDELKPSTLDVNNTFKMKNKEFIIDSFFDIKNSLLVRSYTGRPTEPDAVHIESNGKPVLPGTSVKGALRSRAIKIANTLGAKGEELVKQLFGWANDEGKNTVKYKSRVIVEETEIKNIERQIQTRIKIDRFTGGVMRGSLFDSMPLWPLAGSQRMVNIKITVKDYQPWEVGLLLLIFKDLWSGDLAIGGEKSIGRGLLIGNGVQLIYGNKKLTITRINDDKIKIDGDATELENYVKAFVDKCREEGISIG